IRTRGPAFGARSDVGGTGAVRNEASFAYDQAGQLTGVTAIDRSPGRADEVFTSVQVRDALGRLVRATDPVGQTSRLVYDSRGNVIAASDAHSSDLVSDPLGLYTLGPINGHGNVVHVQYDGLSRPVRS